MTSAQRVIKYCAVGFAFFLIVTIISSIVYGLSFLTSFSNDDNNLENLEVLEIKNEATILDIDLEAANFIVEFGDKLQLETNNENIKVTEDYGKLIVKEKHRNWFKNRNMDVVLYIPRDYVFENVELETGAGKIEIEALSSRRLNFDLGAGNVLIKNLFVGEKAEIDTGAGNFTISNGDISNLDLDMGVGKTTINSKLNGYSDIDCGVGEINLNLLDSINNYRFNLDKGIGSVKINNEEISGNTYGSGTNVIKIDGGVGSINISTYN